ncbi:PTS system, cellobiose-specific IIB component [Caldanaerovirga acetigignens]|uniref:PTS system, cellobiose-specific IIB component n=1 Tax=Caldanaerovirga acetigignens TaxID=447595 RepID=A0A1M7IZQ0_9FIRM|nr:PTS sugar transporter subunit IIB [Caldanaerovirga acetigignens]SHM45657.1 PTS system, cellobiose-specific IIB component [Caldanaerovirga acetigignens]
MKKILLVCSAGMSTSLLVNKMKSAAKEKGIEAEIWSVSTNALEENLAKADVVLLGPQIRFMLQKVKEKGAKYNVPVDAIDPIDYGRCNGANVLEKALKMTEKNF